MNRNEPHPRPRSARRGSVYLLVLGMGTLLTVVGLAVAVTSRINGRNAAADRNLSEAATLGASAVDLAVATINSDSTWRKSRGSDAWNPSVSVGSGALTWKQKDEIDNDIANNPDQVVRVYGEATSGEAARRYSLLLKPKGTRALRVLSCGLHGEGAVTIGAASSFSGGSLSCDGVLTNSSTVTGNVEAASIVNTGSIVGFVTQPSRDKSVPANDVFTDYQNRATTINYLSLSGGTIDSTIVSSSTNPYGAQNPSGLYSISVPAGQTLRIRGSIIQATLVVRLLAGSQLLIRDLVAWEPPSAGTPSLLVYGPATSSVTVMPDSGTVDVPLLGLNLLGIVVVVGSRATAPSELHGLFHVMGGATTSFQQSPRIIGTWIGDGAISITSKSQFVVDPNIAANPPYGYTVVDPTVAAVPGSFRWEDR